MTDNRKSGIALIVGSIGGIVTMAIHPVAAGGLSTAGLERLALVSAIAHSLAIVSMLVLMLGACGLTRYLAAPDRLAFTGVVIYAFAVMAILISAAVSGFIIPNLMRQQARDAAEAAPMWHIVIASIFQINQAFARIFTVAASAAVALWAGSALRSNRLSRSLAIYGCVVTALLIVAICSGFLRLNVHGMGIVALAHAIWFIWVGVQLSALQK